MKTSSKVSGFFLASFLAFNSLTGVAYAHAEHWHGDIRHFHEHDLNLWRGGRWVRGPHSGRTGWWWVADGIWYLYSRPVYPYPSPYIPSTVVVQVPAQPVSVVQALPPPAQTWYYCNNPHGYYPYVSKCPDGWTTVPAVPPQ